MFRRWGPFRGWALEWGENIRVLRVNRERNSGYVRVKYNKILKVPIFS
jgi:hypothetical protein